MDAIRIGVRIFEGPGPFFMGIVNATPDSFSDGGRFLARDAAFAQAERLAEDGADIIDLGGESTRPGAPPVPPEEEIARVVPVIAALRSRGVDVPISIDTRRAAVARAALDAGADLVNDISALADPELAALVAERGVPVVLMHMRGSPADMQSRAVYGDVVEDVARELLGALARAEAAGVRREQTILDPGIGFAKTAEHNLALLAATPRLRALGRPLLVGPSRKAFIGALTGASVEDRLPGTLAAVTAAILGGAELVRVHDVAPARQAGLVAAAIRAASPSGGAAPTSG
ncbi:MAG TPA: dihydropteroate synthase [Anaeromyxobacteraceae bacterium]|nr:dihydropteroate synthase [Anaeromyxobacteraceae bacterium]